MSDSEETKRVAKIPSWQTETSDDSAPSDEEASSKPQSRETVIEQAKRFLEEDEVRDASTDKKIAFLESKGLQGDEIQQLLGVTRNLEATAEASKPPSPPGSPPPRPSPPPAPPSPASPPAPPSPIQTQYEQSTYSPQTRDSPPIITYPEFLTTPTHPLPLITKSRLIATLYIFSSLSFLLYGTSNYLVTPMLTSLTSSRLALLASASTNLTKLISKLEGMVSEIPPTTEKSLVDGEKAFESDSDSDPTELFHRDIGIQTSLPSTPSSPSPSTTNTSLSTQTNKLKGLSFSLRSLLQENTSLGKSTQELETTIGVVREYCDGLAYVQPTATYGFNGGMGRADEKNDEISKVKAGIRGVKGVLLSARSFPGGVRAGVR